MVLLSLKAGNLIPQELSFLIQSLYLARLLPRFVLDNPQFLLEVLGGMVEVLNLQVHGLLLTFESLLTLLSRVLTLLEFLRILLDHLFTLLQTQMKLFSQLFSFLLESVGLDNDSFESNVSFNLAFGELVYL